MPFDIGGSMMTSQLNAPKRWVFFLSIILGLIALALYFGSVFGVIGLGNFATMYYAFWLGIAAWLLLVAGSVLKDF
jgi:hypothetical protein